MVETGYSTIKKLVFDIIEQTEGKVDYEAVTRAVRKHFPRSKWKESHWGYYRSQITSERGRYKDTFGERVKRNLAAGTRKRGRPERRAEAGLKRRNKRETKEERVKRIGDAILEHARFVIGMAAGNDAGMRFKLNRWVYARLMQDEIREKRPIKQALWDSGMTSCQECGKGFKSIKGVEIHRKNGEKVYSLENCELVCRECHQKPR